MLDKLADLKRRYEEITHLISLPETLSDSSLFQHLTREYSELGPVIQTYEQYLMLQSELESNQELLNDSEEDTEIRELAKEEILHLTSRRAELDQEIKRLLIPKDPDDERDIILEIRAGTGGEEAALFAKDLFRMYVRYTEAMKWKASILNESVTDIGGFKEVTLSIVGKGVYSRLKFEAGVHRVQRVPRTETQGRVHTSAATVAVMPEVEEVEIAINPAELRIDVFRASGPGGQSVNTTDSAVRITHLPTGLVVSCQNEKSQLKNKNQAMKVLRARLYEKELAEQQAATSQQRKSMVGSGDRSERIRTYNFPQGRITDHRINLTLYRLENILLGQLDELIDPLLRHDQAGRLATMQVESLPSAN